MFGVSKDAVIEFVGRKNKELSDRLGERMFGRCGRSCFNLYDGEGILGKFQRTINEMEKDFEIMNDEIEELKKEVAVLKPKKKKAKK